MILAGMLDSPYVRRVAVSAKMMGIAFEHQPVSVFRPCLDGTRFGASDVIVACAWRFSQYYDSVEVPAANFPALVAYSARAERLPEFLATPLD